MLEREFKFEEANWVLFPGPVNRLAVTKWINPTITSFLIVILCCAVPIEAKTFKIADYNVENFFDLTWQGAEYPEYVPNSRFGWTKRMRDIKCNNIARVIKDLGADVVCLEEVESKQALIGLRRALKGLGVDYRHIAIAEAKPTVVKCAILSRFPIGKRKEIRVGDKLSRTILEVTIDIDGNSLVLFINHWKSKRGPESLRIGYARALRKEIDKLEDGLDFIVTGDFNSNYNEYKTFRNSIRLNDTNGTTGINHILGTIKDSRMVNEEILTRQHSNRYLYNLWLEIRKRRRWSYNLFGNKESPDAIILSKGLYDKIGISYVDNSFDKFAPDYLFRGHAIYRWQRAQNGLGRHLGKGYSDHLPVFAHFSTEPFHFQTNRNALKDPASSKEGRAKKPHRSVDVKNPGPKGPALVLPPIRGPQRADKTRLLVSSKPKIQTSPCFDETVRFGIESFGFDLTLGF